MFDIVIQTVYACIVQVPDWLYVAGEEESVKFLQGIGQLLLKHRLEIVGTSGHNDEDSGRLIQFAFTFTTHKEAEEAYEAFSGALNALWAERLAGRD